MGIKEKNCYKSLKKVMSFFQVERQYESLESAIKDGDIILIGLLLRGDRSLAKNIYCSPLTIAIKCNKPMMVQCLLAFKVPINDKDIHGRHHLITAIKSNSPEIVRLLIYNEREPHNPVIIDKKSLLTPFLYAFLASVDTEIIADLVHVMLDCDDRISKDIVDLLIFFWMR